MPETTTPAPAQETAPAPTPAPPAPTPDAPLGQGGEAALKAERAARKQAEKDLKDLQDRLKAIEDKDKSELEKATARLAELESSYSTERATRLRLEIASEFGIGKDDLILLTASTEDDLRAQAERIQARIASSGLVPPKPLPGQGTPPAAPNTGSVAAGAALYRQRNQKT